MRPILCNYYVTYRCNARCRFCDIWRRGTDPDADLHQVKANLRDLRRLGVMFIDFTGGEPLLHKDLPQMLREARRLRFITSLTTNCLLYPDLAGEIRGLVDFLHFSLDSPLREENDRIRGAKCFDKVLESIEVAKSLGEKPDILFTVTNQNYRGIAEMAQLAAEERLILIVNPVFSYFDNEGLGREAIEHLRSFQYKPFVYINRAFLSLIEAGGNDVRNPRCRAVSSTVVISPQNEVLLPCFHRYNKKIPIEEGLLRVRDSPDFKESLRNQGRYPFCQGCTINCYFDPSFLYLIDRLFLESMISKVKYGFDKYFRARIL